MRVLGWKVYIGDWDIEIGALSDAAWVRGVAESISWVDLKVRSQFEKFDRENRNMT